MLIKGVIKMDDKLILRRLAIIPTLVCTLNCKLCSNYIPMFRNNVKHVPVDELISDLDKIFEIVDYTTWLQYVGGEIFMRKDLHELYDYSLEKYSDRFDKLILITNATVLPCNEDVISLKRYGDRLQVQISDYGEYSYKLKEMVDLFESHGIPYIIKKYHGDVQHYGGWIDNTSFEDRGRTEKELIEQHKNCGQVAMGNYHMYRGKIQGCARSLLASELGRIIPAERDYVDLYDDTKTIKEKRDIIRHFNDKPRVSCRSCASFLDTTNRYNAAEQE